MAAWKPLPDALPAASGMKTSNLCSCARPDGGGSCDKLAMSHTRASFLLLRSSCTRKIRIEKGAVWEAVQANVTVSGKGGDHVFLSMLVYELT